MRKKIRIPVKMVVGCLGCYEQLEGLAMAISTKILFTSGNIKYSLDRGGKSKARAMKELYGLGYTRFKRALNNAIKYGYMRVEGDLIISNPIRIKNSYSCGATFDNHNLDRIIQILRKIALVHKVNNVNEVFDMSIKARGERVRNSRTYKEFKSAKKNLQYDENRGFHNYISIDTIAKFLNCSRGTAYFIVQDLIHRGTLHKENNISVLGDAVDSCILKSLNENGIGKHFNMHVDGKLCHVQQLPNSYYSSIKFKFDKSFN